MRFSLWYRLQLDGRSRLLSGGRECTKSNRNLVMQHLFHSVDIILKSVVPIHLQKTLIADIANGTMLLCFWLCAILDAKELFKSLPHVSRSLTFQRSFFNLGNFCRTIKACNETSHSCIYYARSHSMCASVECDCGFNTRQGCHVLHYIVWTRD